MSTPEFHARVTGLTATVTPGRRRREAERVLTEGYAHALGLERRLRGLEREMERIAPHADEAEAAQRLRRLAPETRAVRDELDGLRERLGELKAAIAAVPAR